MHPDDNVVPLPSMKRFLLVLLLVPVFAFYGDACRHTWQYFSGKAQARPSDDNSKCMAIDINGMQVPGVEPKFQTDTSTPHNFSDGPELKLVRTQETYYFVDQHGNDPFTKTFNRARPFSEGLAGVSDVSWAEACKEDQRTHLSFGSKPWFYIDIHGKPIAGPFARVSEFHAGRAIVTTLEREWNPVCIDMTGKVVFNDSRFTEIYPFSKDGYAVVSMGWPPKPSGLIDRSGKLLLSDVRFDNFSEGLGAFRDRKTGRFGYMNKDGHIVIEPKFFAAGPFCDGFAAVAYKDEAPTVYEYSSCAKLVYGYIDRTGKFLNVKAIKPTSVITHAGDFHSGQAIITCCARSGAN